MTSASGCVHPESQNITEYLPGGTSGTRKDAVASARFRSERAMRTRPTQMVSAFPTDHQSRGALLRSARSTIE
jgi:hypothetical protein